MDLCRNAGTQGAKGRHAAHGGCLASTCGPHGKGASVGERIAACLETIAAALIGLCMRSPWVTVREAEKYAHVSHGVVADAIRNGELPGYRRSPRSVILVNRRDIDEWISTVWTACDPRARESGRT